MIPLTSNDLQTIVPLLGILARFSADYKIFLGNFAVVDEDDNTLGYVIWDEEYKFVQELPS